jgi:hypothetical protein
MSSRQRKDELEAEDDGADRKRRLDREFLQRHEAVHDQ